MSGMMTLAKSAADTLTQSRPQEWHEDRLIEARGIIADLAQHPDTLVLLACRVICTLTSRSRWCSMLECSFLKAAIRASRDSIDMESRLSGQTCHSIVYNK